MSYVVLCSVIKVACYASGLKVQSEYSTNHVRIDLVLNLPSKLYVVEVEFNKSPEVALAQIEGGSTSLSLLVESLLFCWVYPLKKELCNFTIAYVKKEL